MCHHFGGTFEKGAIREDGSDEITIEADSLLFKDIPRKTVVLLTHGDSASKLAPGFHKTATSSSGICAAFESPERKLYAVQFHPEVDLTEFGKTMFHNFLFDISGCKGTYNMEKREQKAIREIREVAGNKSVLVLVSGGVDSSVCAALLLQALGSDRVYAIHINTGFMRHRESELVTTSLKKLGLKHFQVIDAAETFFNATTTIDGKPTEKLKDVLSPEIKRKIIGDTFMHVSEEASKHWDLKFQDVLLAQGTLRPDLIESASKHASSNAFVIKTHHNDTPNVRVLREAGRIIEPLKDYHKDEVRLLGLELGLPEELIWRQPFPGPGLAIRIICADEPYLTPEDDKIIETLSRFITPKVNVSLLPCRTVGVQGDGRSYRHLVGLSCEEPDWKELLHIAKQIPKTSHDVNRIVYVFGPPLKQRKLTTITPTRLVPPTIAKLQHADRIVNEILLKYNLLRTLSQVPVILFPVDFEEKGSHSIAIRTFITNDFMTGLPATPGTKQLPMPTLREIVKRIKEEVPGIARVCYDLTGKPPATTEWE